MIKGDVVIHGGDFPSVIRVAAKVDVRERVRVRAVAGVTDVTINLVAGGTSQVTVTSDQPLARDDVAAAVDEAGYALAAPGELPLA